MIMIPLFRPSVGEEEIKSIRKSFKTGWIGFGPRVVEFEEAFRKYIGSKYAVGMNSCTAALHLVLKAYGINSGEVIVPALTFVSTAHSVLYNNARPVFADVYEDTLCMDIDDMQKKITNKTKAIIPVHYSGHPCDMDAINEIAKNKKIIVIEDAAQACGAEYKDKKIGSISDATCFSFEAKKNLTTGEGGMVTTDNKEVTERIKRLRWVGINKDCWQRSQKGYSWYYEVVDLGYKYHMFDIQAAMGIVQLKKLNMLNEKRRKIVEFYNKKLSKIKEIELIKEKDYAKSANWNYVIKAENRDNLIEFLKKNGIEAGVHYLPLYKHPFYKKIGIKANVPVTDRVWKKLVTLPLYPDLSGGELNKIAETVKRFFGGL